MGGTGLIGRGCLHQVLRHFLGESCDEAALVELMQVADAADTGEIDYKCFLTWLYSNKEIPYLDFYPEFLAGSLVHAEQDALEKSEPLLRHALQGMEASLGPTHPKTLTFVSNLAILLQELGRHAEA